MIWGKIFVLNVRFLQRPEACGEGRFFGRWIHLTWLSILLWRWSDGSQYCCLALHGASVLTAGNQLLAKQQERWCGNSCLIYQPEQTAHVLRYIPYFRYPLLTCTVSRCLLKTRESSPVKIIKSNEPWHFPKCSVFYSGFVHGVLRTHKSSRYEPRTVISFISPHVSSRDWHPIQYLVKIPGDLSKCTVFMAISIVASFFFLKKNQDLKNYFIL